MHNNKIRFLFPLVSNRRSTPEHTWTNLKTDSHLWDHMCHWPPASVPILMFSLLTHRNLNLWQKVSTGRQTGETLRSPPTCVPLPAVAGQTEGLWVVVAGRSEESSTALNVWTKTWLTGLSGDRVTIVTLHTPASNIRIGKKGLNVAANFTTPCVSKGY